MGTADDQGYAVGDNGRDLDPPAEALVRARRRRAVRQPRQPRECELRGVHDPGCAGAPRPRGSVRRDLGRGERRHHGGRARRGDRARAAGDGEGRERDGGSRGAGGRGERVHGHLPLLPPRLRRYRPLRRSVRHLQHVLDHRRAANARVRHAADDRRVAAPDPRLRDPRVARHRPRAHRSSASGLGVLLAEGIEGLFRALGVELPYGGPRLRAAHGRSWRSSSASASRSSRALPRHPGDPRAADRGGARGCDASEVEVRAVRAVGRRARRRRRARRTCARDVHRRARDRRSVALDRGRRSPALPRRRDALVARRTPARGGQQPDRPLGGVRLHRAGLAALAAPVLAPALRSVGPGIGRAPRRRLRRRHTAQSAARADRPRHVAAAGGDEVGAGVANGVPRCRSGSRRRTHRRRERPQEPRPDGGDRRGADDRDRARLVHRDADERDEGVEPRGDRGADRRRLRRDLARRVHAVRRGGGRRARRVSRARGRDQRPLRRRPGRRRHGRGRRHRARHDRRGLRLRLARGRRERARHARYDERGRELELRARITTSRSATSSRFARPPTGRRRSRSSGPSSRRRSTR